ncbi:hypothetical protein Cch01nite_05340 [Cellulomonas chitinilytica]|uniref:Uncharacterized protein n=1 Tax=Cellulomonas chitinilytica TaxID=398759 RepID=A0A919NZD5_9CELL|nr:DUF5691 domain-containing protein [Cellulomonas chitinilytica]GIG19810.1 hypothetical protein Cch01nite_05340 [Cellulomonas chitinilytica]
MSADLTTAALLGTDRNPGPHPVGDELLAAALSRLPAREDPATALLDVAALAAVARRASTSGTEAGTVRAPAPTETRQLCAPAAAARLRGLLAAGKESWDLLELWLATAAGNGLRVPPGVLVPLLDAAAAAGDRDGLRTAALAVSGERGRWITPQNPAWHGLVAAPRPGVDAIVTDDDPTWVHGTADERAAWLSAARSLDPAGARSLVAGAWAKANANERATFARALEVGVTPDDEELLASALSDRSVAVRTAAVRTLAHLPSSAFVRHCTDRALACVTVSRTLLREHLVMELPEPEKGDPFAAPYSSPKAVAVTQMLGLPAGVGAKADLLTRLVEVVPLSAWTAHLGKEPRTLVQLAIAANARPLLQGWAVATEREHDAAWAHALLVLVGARSISADLARILPPEAQLDVFRATVSAAPAGYEGHPAVAAYLAQLPAPWTDDLTAQVATWVGGQPSEKSWTPIHTSEQLGLAAPPTARSESVIRAAAARAAENVSRALTRAADAVHQRRTIIEELT